MYAHSVQSASNDCGVASIETILKQLKIKFDGINFGKILNHSVEQGLSIANMQTLLKEYGVMSEAYQVTSIEELEKQQFPLILMCKNEGLPHYIVLHKIEGNQFTVSDPAKPQILVKTREEILKTFMGYAICIESIEKKKNTYQINLLYRKIMSSLSLKSKLQIICFSILKYVCPLSLVFFMQYVMIYQMENITMPYFSIICVFFLSLMLGYFIINVADSRLKTMTENKFQKTVLLDYYRLKIKNVIDKKDIDQIMGYFYNLMMSVTGVLYKFYLKVDILFVGILCAVLMRINLFLAISIILWAAAFAVIIRFRVNRIRNAEKNMVNTLNGMSASIEEQVRLSLDIQLFSKCKDAENKLLKKMEGYFDGKIQANEEMAFIDSVFEFISACVLLTTFGLFVYCYESGINQSMTALLLSVFIISIILARLKPVAQTWVKYQKSAIAVEYIQNNETVQKEGQICTEENLGESKIQSITLNNITYSYEEKHKVIENFTVEFKQGEITGITGANGSGKSTLLKMILGLIEPDEGQIQVNGKSYFSLVNKNIREYITSYSPEMNLFQNTVQNNILFQLHSEHCGEYDNQRRDFSLPFPDNYVVYSRGNNLSQGQIQKLLLMRCLQQNKDIYIFDEPTSNLDAESIEVFENIIEKLAAANKIVIVISHEPDILKRCNTLYSL